MPEWAGVMTPEELELTAMTLGPSAFARGYRQEPQADGDLIFPSLAEGKIYEYRRDWRKISDPDHAQYNESSPFFVSPSWPRYTGVDLSGEKRRGNVIFTLALSPANVRHVVEIRLGAWKSTKTAEQIEEAYLLHRPRAVFVENNNYQQAIIDWMEDGNKNEPGRFTSVNKIEPFTTGRNKMDLEIGLPSIEFQYSLGSWKVAIPHAEYQPSEPSPHDQSVCICGLCTFIRAALTFTQADLKDNTPDTVAAQFIAKEASRLFGSMGEANIGVVRASQADMQKVMEAAYERGRQMRIPAGVPHLGSNRPLNRNQVDGFGRPVGRYARQAASQQAAEETRTDA